MAEDKLVEEFMAATMQINYMIIIFNNSNEYKRSKTIRKDTREV